MEKLKWIKGMAAVLCTAAAAWSGAEFYAMRHYKEPVALGPGVTQVQKLSLYEPSLQGTANDCNIYFLDSGKPGGTVLLLGGTHPEEPRQEDAAQVQGGDGLARAGRSLGGVNAHHEKLADPLLQAPAGQGARRRGRRSRRSR